MATRGLFYRQPIFYQNERGARICDKYCRSAQKPIHWRRFMMLPVDSESDEWSYLPSLRGANGSRECAPDDRLRDEAIQPSFVAVDCFACARNDDLKPLLFGRISRQPLRMTAYSVSGSRRKIHPSRYGAASSTAPPRIAAWPRRNPPLCPTIRSRSAMAAPRQNPDGGRRRRGFARRFPAAIPSR